jgi:tungstate transport system substrate-binding protein
MVRAERHARESGAAFPAHLTHISRLHRRTYSDRLLRGLIATLASATALLAILATPASATDLVIQGTSDVVDSGLFRDRIEKRFERKYSQYDLQYISGSSSQALGAARGGQADVVIVNAPSLEEDFVNDGFSQEARGRALFYNDFVIVGPPGDPAGSRGGAHHDAARAFERKAAAGAAGRANFVSRGDNDGTNLAERSVWDKTDVARNSRDEPGNDAKLAPWYRKTGAGQGDTLVAAEKCAYAGGACYALTDRGTFEQLADDGDVDHLQVLVENNDDDSPGGAGLLVNPYHGYIPRESKVANVDLRGAQRFLDFLTSTDFQSDLKTYPRRSAPAFLPDARPDFNITAPAGARLPREVAASDVQVVRGTLTHLQPAFPALDSARLFVQRAESSSEFDQAADTRTGSDGTYRMTFRPTRSGKYRLYFPGGFDLQAAARSLGAIRVRAVVNLTSAKKVHAGGVRLKGKAYPDRDRADARLVVQARRAGTQRYKRVSTVDLSDTGRSFSTTVELDNGTWQLRVRYEDPDAVASGYSQPRSVSVG